MRAHGTPLPNRVRLAVRNRDGNKCRFCWSTDHLHVHHLDEHGQNHVSPNHDPSNLITLCRRCHFRVHSEELLLTPEIIARAERVRRGDEVLLPKLITDDHDVSVIGDSISTYRYVLLRPEEAFFENHPEEECQPDCQCGTDRDKPSFPFVRKFSAPRRSPHY